ncbi:MAG: histidine phosphatase family protein [Sphingomonadaceae bacterium]|nr:histidine phosphatase family protein [Sphingomonadaceae bacterium]
MTKTLFLLRHAKSGWDDPVARDFDRPLNRRGEKAARTVGQWMASQGVTFEHVIASPAVRVIETLDGLWAGYGRKLEPTWERRIYLASSATLLDVLREVSDAHDSVLMVGHNPGMEDVVVDLVADDGSSPLRDEVEVKFPTAALAQLEIDIDHWADIGEPVAQLKRFVRPRDLDPSLGPDAE